MEQEQERKEPPKPKLTRAVLQVKYQSIIDLPKRRRDKLAARTLWMMAKRGECKILNPLTGKLTADQREIRKILDGGYEEVNLTNL